MDATDLLERPDARDPAALWQDAMAHHGQRRFAAAGRCCAAIVAACPRHFDALHLLGFCLMQEGRHAEAVPPLRRALALNPRFAPAHFNLGVALSRMDLLDEAIACFDRAIALKPDYARAHNNRGTALRRCARHDDALASFDRAIEADPHYGEAYSNRGITLHDLHRLEAALADLDMAVALCPDAAAPHLNRGNVLKDLGRAAEALASHDRAVACDPAWPDAHAARGNALTDLNRLDAALAAYDAALAVAPGHPNATWNKSLALLAAGDLAGGLALYEVREGKQASQGLRVFYQPEWTGAQDLAGQTLFVYWEQGLGDTIQFCRFARLAAARAGRVVLSVQEPLVGLLRQLAPEVEVIGGSRAPAAFDYHIALMSLPRALGLAGAPIPAPPAYLQAPAAEAAAWAERLGAATRPRIGVAWTGNPLHRNDRQRSMTLAALAPLAGLDAEWVCLHKEFRLHDRHALADWPGLRVPGAQLGDFSDTAGLVANLDLVVTVDTSVAHLSAAMGVPTWVMLPYAPDWRWMLERRDSPWYPAIRLFRQPEPGDWASVVAEVAAQCAAWLPAR